jgi:hypothetical protein
MEYIQNDISLAIIHFVGWLEIGKFSRQDHDQKVTIGDESNFLVPGLLMKCGMKIDIE